MTWNEIASYSGVGTYYQLQHGFEPDRSAPDALRVLVCSGPTTKELKRVALTGSVARDIYAQRELGIWMMDEALTEVAEEMRHRPEPSAAPRS